MESLELPQPGKPGLQVSLGSRHGRLHLSARLGLPEAGTKVLVRPNQFLGGRESPSRTNSPILPAAP